MRTRDKVKIEHKVIMWMFAAPFILTTWVALVALLIACIVPGCTYTGVITNGFIWVCAIPIGLILLIAWCSNLEE